MNNLDLSILASNLALENAELRQQIIDLTLIIEKLHEQLDDANSKRDSVSLNIEKLQQHLKFCMEYAEDIDNTI